MQKNVALPSKYLNGSDVGGQLFELVIKSIVMEKMENDGAMKPVMYFTNAQKGLVVNATNWDNMAVVYEDESENWIGKTVEMYTEATRTPNGQPTRGVRIRPVAGPDTAAQFVQAPLGGPGAQPTSAPAQPGTGQPVGPGEQAAAQAQQVTTPSPAAGGDLDDEIPF